MSGRRTLYELVDAVVDGSATAAERRALEHYADDPQGRRRLVRLIVLEGALADSLRGGGTDVLESMGESERLQVPPARSAPVEPRRSHGVARRSARGLRRQPLTKVVAVGAVLVVLLVAVVVVSRLADRSDPPSADPPPAAVAALATVLGVAPEAGQLARDGSWQGLVDGQGLQRDAVLRGPLSLRLSDGTRFDLGSGARLQLQAPQRHRLETGQIDVVAVRRAEDAAALEIVTPHATTRALGTRFRVQCDTTATTCAVSEGRVRFSSAAQAIVLAAGETAIAEQGGELRREEGGAMATGLRIDRENAAAFLGTRSQGRVVDDGIRPLLQPASPDSERQVAAVAGEVSALGRLLVQPGMRLRLRYSLAGDGAERMWIVLVLHAADGDSWRCNIQHDLQAAAGSELQIDVPLADFDLRAGKGPRDGHRIHGLHIGTQPDRLDDLVVHAVELVMPE